MSGRGAVQVGVGHWDRPVYERASLSADGMTAPWSGITVSTNPSPSPRPPTLLSPLSAQVFLEHKISAITIKRL